ncbi:MAG TPA: peptidylprolyl isomerase [Aggregatilineaceae bacterium]|nr:peptidylprolyl isomerase [Aggregatilineaceae bacterium]
MAKKSTTGGPRARRITSADIERRKTYRSRAEKEKVWQRRVLIITSVVVAISVLIIVAALAYEQLLVPRQWIAKVNGTEIKTSDFKDRVEYERWKTAYEIRSLYDYVLDLSGDKNSAEQYALQDDGVANLQSPDTMGSQVLSQMEEDLVIQQEAKKRGLKADEAAIDQAVNEYMSAYEFFGAMPDIYATATAVPSLTPTPLVPPTATPTTIPTEATAEATAEVEAAATTEAEATTEVAATSEATVEAEATAEVAATAEATAEGTAEAEPTVTPTPTATLEPGQIEATLDKASSNYYKQADEDEGFKRETIRDVFYNDALEKALREAMADEVATTELRVKARHILIAFPETAEGEALTQEQKDATKAEAEAVIAALQGGEPFADLARAESDDPGSATQGGMLMVSSDEQSTIPETDWAWTNPEGYVEAFKDAVINGEIGVIQAPVETEFGYHIIQVLGRNDAWVLPEALLTQRQNEAYQTWLSEAKATAKIERREDWVDRIPEEPTYNDLLSDILPEQ